MNERLLLTPEEASYQLRLSRAYVYELLASGELESITCGRSRRIPAEALTDFVESRRRVAKAEAVAV